MEGCTGDDIKHQRIYLCVFHHERDNAKQGLSRRILPFRPFSSENEQYDILQRVDALAFITPHRYFLPPDTFVRVYYILRVYPTAV